MSENDTIHLLRECDAGTRMAVSSINDVLDKVKNSELRELLTKNRSEHEEIGGELRSLLSAHQTEEKEPPMMAKSMSWMKMNLKMSMDESDETIADLMTDGCDMGVKSLHKYLNQYADADETSKEICRKISSLEEGLCEDLRSYL